jgi:hypothetical protein
MASLWGHAVVGASKPQVGHIVTYSHTKQWEGMPFLGADLRSAINTADWRGHANDRFVLM